MAKGTGGPKLSQTSVSKNMGSLSGKGTMGHKTGNVKGTKLPYGGCPANMKKAGRKSMSY